MSILLRPEPFGGLAARIGYDTVRLFGKPAYCAIESVALGLSDTECVRRVAAKFPEVTVARTTSWIQGFRHLVNTPSDWEIDSSFGGVSTAEFPTLSYPLDISWEVTRKCNQFCRHCYNNSDHVGANPTWSQLKSILDEIAGVQLRAITVTGGEPLMRKDFKEFSELIKDAAFDRILNSNATLITHRNIDWISECYTRASISIDVADCDAYDEFRGRKGSFQHCVNGLRLLLQQDVDVVAQTTLSRYNINALEELAQFLIDLGVRTWSCRLPFDSGRAPMNSGAFLSRPELNAEAERIDAIREKYAPQFDDLRMGVTYLKSYSEPYNHTNNPDRLMTCAAATVMATINADGTLSPCNLFSETDYRSPPIWETGLQKQWAESQPFREMRNVHLSDIKGCATCKNAQGTCGGGCRAQAYLAFRLINRAAGECNYSRDRAADIPVRVQ
jgi:radical SAM protein with 4Fe4S-binding SPASM domain